MKKQTDSHSKYDKALHKTELRSPEWLWEYLGQVICPTLILYGAESDILLPEVAQKARGTLLFGSLVEIERAGHNNTRGQPKGVRVRYPQVFEQRPVIQDIE